jgi:tetratricopeptide (TPR) repeat protein
MRRAIALYEREKGPNDPGLIVPLYRLAQAVSSSRKDYDEATRLTERAAAIAKASLGEGHPRTAYTLSMLGDLESLRGNFAKAEQLSRIAVEIFDRTLGRREASVGDAYIDRAKVFARVGRWADVEAAQRIAITVYENALGRAHAVYAGAIGGLCATHIHVGRLSDAEAECREARAIRRRAQGDRSLGLLGPLILLGDIQTQNGELTSADSLYSATLSILQEHVGVEARMYEYLYPRMAVLRDLQHRPAEAAELRKKAGGKPVRPIDF